MAITGYFKKPILGVKGIARKAIKGIDRVSSEGIQYWPKKAILTLIAAHRKPDKAEGRPEDRAEMKALRRVFSGGGKKPGRGERSFRPFFYKSRLCTKGWSHLFCRRKGMKPRDSMNKKLSVKQGVGIVLPGGLLEDIRKMIHEAREGIARTVNTAQTALYWNVGLRIRQDVLKEKRADYGEKILATLSQKLCEEYGSGFSTSNLSRMIGLTEAFPDQEEVLRLASKLSWSHFIQLVRI